MGRKFIENPNSLVSQAVAQAGGPTKLAEKLGLSAQTVGMWVKNDLIPVKHVIHVAHAGDLNVLDLIEYAERKKKPWFFKSAEKKPGSLETLVALQKGEITLSQAYLKTDLKPRVIKQTLTIWGERIELLKNVMESDENSAVKAERLGVSTRQLNRLINAYLPPKPAEPDKPYLVARKQAKGKWGVRKNQAIRVIRGDATVVDAAKAIELSERQMHRWMDKTLGEQFNLGLNQIRGLPKSFRYALAVEVEREHPEVAVHLITLWKQKGLAKRDMPSAPESWKRTTIRRALIGLFLAEISLLELCEARETDRGRLVPLLNGQMIPLGVSFEQVQTYSTNHQEAIAEILNSMEVAA